MHSLLGLAPFILLTVEYMTLYLIHVYMFVFFRINCEFEIMADWDADDFEPDVPATVSVPKVTDKWDGEDEDDDVKVKSIFLQFFRVESVRLDLIHQIF